MGMKQGDSEWKFHFKARTQLVTGGLDLPPVPRPQPGRHRAFHAAPDR